MLIGMHDYGTGLDAKSFEVKADFAINDLPAGENLASKFEEVTQGVWELKAPHGFSKGSITAAVKDVQGNETRIERAVP